MTRPALILMTAAIFTLTAASCVQSDQQRTEAGIAATGSPSQPPALMAKDAPASTIMAAMADAGVGVSRAMSPVEKALDLPQSDATASMIIRTGNASIEVEALEAAIDRVRQLAQRLGGFVGNTSTQTGRGQIRSAMLELKIPAARFDEALTGLKPLGTVEAINVQTEDVGEEFVDITARQTNAKKLEERLLALLATRTGKLEDVVAVERELSRVREAIDRYEARLRYLRAHVSMSTLSVSVHEQAPILPPHAGPSPIGEAFRQAWRNCVGFVAMAIASLGWMVPLLALTAIGYGAWRRWAPAKPPKLATN